jgi:hypothetical protein
MAKYYIQSGNVSYIVCACDLEGAALWVMHRVMDQKIADFEMAQSDWLDDSSGDDLQSDSDQFYEDNLLMGIPEAIPYDAMLEGLAEFEETICISERGFGRDEAGQLQTENIFHQWRQLMLAVDRLHDEQN